MEIELKYRISGSDQVRLIMNDPEIAPLIDSDSEETIDMYACYFDTADHRLMREGVSFRVRRENKRIVATVKWNGTSEDGMHEREEINIPVDDESRLKTPDIDIFAQSPMRDTLKRLIGDRELRCIMETVFERRQVRIDTGAAIMEMSADIGRVICDGSTGDISELEIELYSGDRNELERFGGDLAAKYALMPENRSKLRQGLDLIR